MSEDTLTAHTTFYVITSYVIYPTSSHPTSSILRHHTLRHHNLRHLSDVITPYIITPPPHTHTYQETQAEPAVPGHPKTTPFHPPIQVGVGVVRPLGHCD